MTDHASTVLYPAIQAALAQLAVIPEGHDAKVDAAFNFLHDAYWSETPAHADRLQRRGGNDFPLGKACDLSGETDCEACQ